MKLSTYLRQELPQNVSERDYADGVLGLVKHVHAVHIVIGEKLQNLLEDCGGAGHMQGHCAQRLAPVDWRLLNSTNIVPFFVFILRDVPQQQ